MKSLSNYLVLILIGLGLIIGLIELTLWINKLFMYPLAFGLVILIILGGMELVEKNK